MNARDLLTQLTSEHLSPLLRHAGFKKSGFTYRRPIVDMTHVINLQLSDANQGLNGRFYINVGLYVPPVSILMGRTLTLDELESQLDQAEVSLRTALADARDDFCVFEIRHTCNALRYLTVHGLRNHRYQPVIALYQWIADHLPACYGLLYIRDNEDLTRTGHDYSNCFRVWRLARGQLSELADPFLSPCIPVIERPEQSS